MLRSPVPPTRIRTLAASVALALLPMSVMFAMTPAAPAARLGVQGPCDIYALAGTPCVAAHSTTRALYASYDGPLYQVRRLSDGRVKDIGVVPPTALPVPDAGGYADAAAQDAFCANTTTATNALIPMPAASFFNIAVLQTRCPRGITIAARLGRHNTVTVLLR